MQKYAKNMQKYAQYAKNNMKNMQKQYAMTAADKRGSRIHLLSIYAGASNCIDKCVGSEG